MKKNLKLLTIVSALIVAVSFTTCKQFREDPEEMLSYWTSEVIPKGFSISGTQTTNSEGILCIPSASDVTLTINLHNPRKFKLVMPRNSTDAHNIIHFPGFSGSQPAYGSTGDYTLKQTADDKLELTYKSSFLKKYEWSSQNIGPEITFISTDGRKFSKKFSLNLKVDTPPKLSSTVTIGKTASPIGSKYYYVIILKAEDMSETAGTPSELLHKEIKTLSVTHGTGDSTPLNIAFTGTSGFPTGDRLLALGAVNSLGSGEGPETNSSLISDPWALRYRTDTEVKTASKTYTFTLIDAKGLKSSPITVPTPLLKAEDAKLFYNSSDISMNAISLGNPYTINAGLNDTQVTVTAKTATRGAKITGRLEKPNDSSWVPRTIDSGPWNEVDIRLPAPGHDQEVLYKISLTAGGDGFDTGTEKVFYVKVTKHTTITISSSETDAWTKLKTAVENSSPGAPSVIIIDGTIKAPSVPSEVEKIMVRRNVTIEGNTGSDTDKLDANNRICIFHIWVGRKLTLKKLTLLKGNNVNSIGGAIYCEGGELTTEDVIIEKCKAKNGGAIYAKDAVVGIESTSSVITLKNTQIKICEATGTGTGEGRGGAIYCEKSTLTLDNTTIGGSAAADGNKAKNGGGIYIADGTLTLEDGTVISRNTAQNDGGGVYINAQAPVGGLPPVEIIFKMSGSATIPLSTGIDLNVAGKNDVYLNNDGDYAASIIVTGELTSAFEARLTMKHVFNLNGSGYSINRWVVKGINSDADASKFKVTPEPATILQPNIQNWRLEYIVSGSGEGIGRLKHAP